MHSRYPCTMGFSAAHPMLSEYSSGSKNGSRRSKSVEKNNLRLQQARAGPRRCGMLAPAIHFAPHGLGFGKLPSRGGDRVSFTRAPESTRDIHGKSL